MPRAVGNEVDMNRFGFLFIFLFYGGTNFYIARRLYLWIHSFFPRMNAVLFGIVFFLLSSSTLISLILSDRSIGSFLGAMGNHWMGIYVFLLTFFLLSDIVSLILKLTRVIPKALSPEKYLFFSGLLVLLVTIFLGVYGRYTAMDIKTTEYQITIEKKDTSLESLNIVMISDVHLGYINDSAFFESLVSKINALAPDMVLIAGDFFDGNFHALDHPEKVSDALQKIESTYGVFLCYGNHDAGTSFARMDQLVKDGNVTVLEDTAVSVQDLFYVVGRKDASPIGGQGEARKNFEELEGFSDLSLPVFVLDHKPSHLLEYKNEVDLVLCGHTHQGQIFPFRYVTERMFLVDYGHYFDEGVVPQVVVSSGVGTWGLPIRIGTKSEIVQIHIQFEA